MCLLQLDKMAKKGLPDSDYDKQIISWAVPRMRLDLEHLQIGAVGGILAVWEAIHGHSPAGGHIIGSCLLHIKLPVEDNDLMMSAHMRMLGMAFHLGKALHGAKNAEWVCPYGPYA